jgi:hypothetical protein
MNELTKNDVAYEFRIRPEPDPHFQSGGDAIIFAGIPGLIYTLQRAPKVSGPWNTIGTVTVGNAGIGMYLDADRPAGNAFYRALYP